MFGVSLFVLREVFEIALILSVVLGATRQLQGRTPFLIGGFAVGIVGAALIAAFTGTLSALADGMGQEMLNSAILIIAAAMIGWTAVWMRVHGREFSQKVKAAANDSSMWVLSAVIALAVFREGAEMVLFSFGAHAQGTSWLEIAMGAAMGVAGGVVIGVLFYIGMLKLFAKHFLNITSTLLAFLAAGLAARGVYYLAMIGILPEFGYAIWDSSAILSNNSLLGESLGVLVGYNATPSGIELMVYVATLLATYAGYKYSQHESAKKQQDYTTSQALS